MPLSSFASYCGFIEFFSLLYPKIYVIGIPPKVYKRMILRPKQFIFFREFNINFFLMFLSYIWSSRRLEF